MDQPATPETAQHEAIEHEAVKPEAPPAEAISVEAAPLVLPEMEDDFDLDPRVLAHLASRVGAGVWESTGVGLSYLGVTVVVNGDMHHFTLSLADCLAVNDLMLRDGPWAAMAMKIEDAFAHPDDPWTIQLLATVLYFQVRQKAGHLRMAWGKLKAKPRRLPLRKELRNGLVEIAS